MTIISLPTRVYCLMTEVYNTVTLCHLSSTTQNVYNTP